ncbi:MAG TPA: hypothetical protein VHL11_04525 [Phototrophicaceae bacterium]|jgi:hypothetical protein|nr:hypothetical protein [Phototrophicaceae bacterium]
MDTTILLLPAPSARTLERWGFIQRRIEHYREHGVPEWELRHGDSGVSVGMILGRQLVTGHYTRNSKYLPDAIHVELSIDEDHRIVHKGQEGEKRFKRMLDRLKRCADRQAVKAVKTPKVIYALGACQAAAPVCETCGKPEPLRLSCHPQKYVCRDCFEAVAVQLPLWDLAEVV